MTAVYEEYEDARERAYHSAMNLASAVCYGTTPEYLEQLKSEFVAADELFRAALGIPAPKPYVRVA